MNEALLQEAPSESNRKLYEVPEELPKPPRKPKTTPLPRVIENDELLTSEERSTRLEKLRGLRQELSL